MYDTLYDLIQAMQNGEVSKKNTIYIDNDSMYCDERYDSNGVEIPCPEGIEEDDFESKELYHGDNPECELLELLKAFDIDASFV